MAGELSLLRILCSSPLAKAESAEADAEEEAAQ